MKNFSSFGTFAAHLAERVEKMREADERALNRVGVLVERRAKAKIGEYQGGVGPFVAWGELADSTKDDRVRQGFTENDPGLRSGAMQRSIGHQADDRESHIGSNDENLVRFELGTSKQPPRSVLGAAAFEEGDKIAKLLGGGAVAALIGDGVNMKLDGED